MCIGYASFLLRLWREASADATSPLTDQHERSDTARCEGKHSGTARCEGKADRGAVGSGGDWHSQVEHIQSGQRWTFNTMDELLDFLRREAEEPEVMNWSPGRE